MAQNNQSEEEACDGELHDGCRLKKRYRAWIDLQIVDTDLGIKSNVEYWQRTMRA